MPQNLDNRNPVPKYNSRASFDALAKKNNGKQKGGSFVHPGTQDLGSWSGQVDRERGGDGRLADSRTQTRHMAEDTAKMRAKLSARKQSATRGKAASGMLAMMMASQAIANRRAGK
jgi:hypothetical protein